MFDHIVRWSLRNQFLVLLATFIVSALGLYSLGKLNLDAFPDVTPVQVQVNTVAPSLNPEEIEQQISFPIERAMGGLPGLANLRSISKFGFSQVVLTFSDDTNLYLARQLVAEKLQTVELPRGVARPSLGPISTGLGEVFHYQLKGKEHSLMELTTIQDWIVKPRLAAVPGVAEVNTWGGKRKQYQVILSLKRLQEFGLEISRIREVLIENNFNVGGGNISRGGEMNLIHGVGLLSSTHQIENLLIDYREDVPVRVKDIAQVKIGHEIRRGAVTANGEGEIVLGLVFMLYGENSLTVSRAISERANEINSVLPEGVSIEVLYERTDLVNSVIETVSENLLLGALLVIAILFWFLGNLRAGLIVASAIPLCMLFAFTEMVQFSIAGSLLSLGAIDFGLIIDSSVIVVENTIRKLETKSRDIPLSALVEEATLEVRKPTMYGELIILIVFIPVLALEGVEGKLFIPMALTMIFALAGSFIASLTFTPVLTSLLLKNVKEKPESRMMQSMKGLYSRLLNFTRAFHKTLLFLAIILGGLGFWGAGRLGSEFIPRLDEGAIVINTVRLAGVSLEQSIRYGSQIETLIKENFQDEVKNIWTRTGTAQTATDPMGLEVSDVFITLHERELWTKASTQSELTSRIRKLMDGMPAMRAIYTQPIEMRVNEMSAGIRSDLGIKIFGDDFEQLKTLAQQVNDILEATSGSTDVYLEQITGQGIVRFELMQEELARYGIQAREVLDLIAGIGTISAGEIRENQRRFELVLRLEDQYRNNLEKLNELVLNSSSGKLIPLGRLARVDQTEGPSTITREWQKRRITVQCNIENQDLGGFVDRIRDKIEQELVIPPGYHLEYGGQYENLQRAQTRLLIIIPTALILVFCLLYISTGRVVDSLIIFSGAPFAAIGGIAFLTIRNLPFTISAAVGFIAVCGVAMLNGLVLMSAIRTRIDNHQTHNDAIYEGALERLRPVLMTALVASLGFFPMALNTGIGAEVQRPLATVVIGGVVSDCILTLLILPALCFFLLGKTRD